MKIMADKKLSSRDIYNLGVAYRLFIKDVEKTADALFRMYDEGVLQKGSLHIKRFLLKEGGYDYSLVEKMTAELEKGKYEILDRKTFKILVDAVKDTLIDNIKKTIPNEIKNTIEFQRGFGALEEK